MARFPFSAVNPSTLSKFPKFRCSFIKTLVLLFLLCSILTLAFGAQDDYDEDEEVSEEDELEEDGGVEEDEQAEKERFYNDWKENQIDPDTMDRVKGNLNQVPNCKPDQELKCDTVFGVAGQGGMGDTKYFNKPQQYCRCEEREEPDLGMWAIFYKRPPEWVLGVMKINAVTICTLYTAWIIYRGGSALVE